MLTGPLALVNILVLQKWWREPAQACAFFHSPAKRGQDVHTVVWLEQETPTNTSVRHLVLQLVVLILEVVENLGRKASLEEVGHRWI